MITDYLFGFISGIIAGLIFRLIFIELYEILILNIKDRIQEEIN